MAGRVGARCAISDLAAVRGTTFDSQERCGNIAPVGVPLDTAALDRVLCFKYQCVFGFQAVVNRRGTWKEIANQIKHAVTHTGDINADVLHVEALA